ncbi:MAG: terpene cyclase/mutase family protein [Planctomycetes bacterium]|nr:terpene cyclase/mutase family protein [Planctomycetota bacterium]MCB9825585.1 terpene cyclase/mutase family protein [Planctomycetota bacterium]
MPRSLPVALVLAALLLLPLGACGDTDKGTGSGSGAGTDTAGAPPADGSPNGTELAANAGVDADAVKAAMERGRAFLLAQQDASGAFGDPAAGGVDTGYTGMAVMGLVGSMSKDEVRSNEAIKKALAWMVSQQKEDGSIWDKPIFTNYHTSSAVGALAAARVPEFATAQAKARAFLVASQIAGDESDPSYGGFPYKQQLTGAPADLSNMQIAAQALKDDGGVPADSPVWARMQRYLRRVQNSSETNDWTATMEIDGEQREVVPADDGGGFYNPAHVAKDFKAGLVQRSDGRYEPRSYGSMSYALLKCLLFAGVPAGDPRVERVVKWVSEHWTVERNPGFEHTTDAAKSSRKGWFYYLYTASRALDEYENVTGKPLTVRDADGRPHAWRKEMADVLIGLQGEDGSWHNPDDDSWDEGSKVLGTAYALQTLAILVNRLP